jgi:hypothetical protein
MTVFTITDFKSITDLSGKVGDDSYNINGGTLLIDSDSRFGKNQGQSSGCLGNILVSSTLGGELRISTAGVMMFPFTGGNGSTPNAGTIITQGSASAEIICVMQSKTGGNVITSSMPSSAWVKVRNVSGVFTAGAVSGANMTFTSSGEQGWIILAGTDTRTFTIPRMGSMTVDGQWLSIGVTSGTIGQTFQLPFFTSESSVYYPGVEIETAANSGMYEFWANAGSKFTSSIVSTDSRSKFVHISTTGVCTLGLGTDNKAAGELPVSGCRVRIPSIILQTANSAAKQLNNEPSSTLGNRYEAQFSSAGVLNHNLSTGSWYWNIIQPYSISLNNLHSCDQVMIGEVAQPPIIDRLHVGLSTRATHIASPAIQLQQCYNGGTVGVMSALRADATSTSGYASIIVNLYGNWTFADVRAGYASPATAISGPFFVNACDDITIDKLTTVCKRLLISASNRIKVKRHIYADNLTGTTATTLGSHAVEIVSQSKDIEIFQIENFTDVPNNHPYSGVVYASNVFGLKVRYIGTPSQPYNAGTINPSGYLFSDGGNNSDVKLQRIWTKNLRLGMTNGTNTTVRYKQENCYNEDSSKTVGPQQQNAVVRGNRCNAGNIPTSYVSVYGNHGWDSFTSDTTSRLALILTEKNAGSSNAYVIDSGNPKFTSQGTVAMQAGDSCTWTWGYYILGWTGLVSTAKQAVNPNNFVVEYDLDKGNGFSGVFKLLTDANLQSETSIQPTTGFKPKIRVSCSTNNLTNLLTSLRIEGTTSLQYQNTALYPLDVSTLYLNNLVQGSTVAVFEGEAIAGSVPVSTSINTPTSAVITYPQNDMAVFYTVRIRKAGYDVVELRYNNTQVNTIPIAQQENKDGFGIAVLGRGLGTTSSLVTFDASALRIDIGNGKANAEDIYDTASKWQASELGIRYPEVIRFDGVDLLLVNSWLFRRKDRLFTSAGVDALPVVNGQPSASPDDESNGSVDFKARSVRTFEFGASGAPTAEVVADVLKTSLAPNFEVLQKFIDNQMYDVYDNNQVWYALTNNGESLLGVTKDNPYGMDLPSTVSIHEFDGVIPDLNFNKWNFDQDKFLTSVPSRIQFYARFTIDELVALRASTNIVVKQTLERWDALRHINLIDQLNIDSVNHFISLNLLSAERATEILT